MKELEQFAGKRMPYKESDEYVSRLIDRCVGNAMSGNSKRNSEAVKTFWLRLSSVAAVLALVVTAYFGFMNESEFDVYKDSATLAEVLASMSDEQVMDLYCYEIDEIPEYYE